MPEPQRTMFQENPVKWLKQELQHTADEGENK
jgi:hypothetical protein